MRRLTTLLALTPAVVTAALGVGPTPAPATAASTAAEARAPRIGFWAGSLNIKPCATVEVTSCPRDFAAYTDEVWDLLEVNDGFLNLNLIYGADFGPAITNVQRRTDALPIIREANARGVEINAWITLPVGQGTFSNENNAGASQDAVKAFAGWTSTQGLRFDSVELDLEFPLGWQAIQKALETGDTSDLEEYGRANFNPAHQCAAVRTYRETVAWAHAHGLAVNGSPIPFAVDDLLDGNLALADMFDMAVPTSDYDQLYAQAYRAFGVDLGTGFVASYFTDMQRLFGARGQVTLGNTGIAPYDKVAPLVTDIRMLAAMGAAKIPVFDLDSAIRSYGAAGLAQVFAAADEPMSATELAAAKQPSATGAAARGMFRALDGYATFSTFPWSWQLPNAYPGGCR